MYLVIPTSNSQKIIPCNSSHSFPRIFLFNLSLSFIFRFRRFHEDLLSKKDRALRAFHPTFPLSLSPLYPSLSFSLRLFPSLFIPLYPSLSLLLSLPLSLFLLSLPPSLYLSFYLSFSLFPSLSLLFIILFGVSNGHFRPCFSKSTRIFYLYILLATILN